MDMAERTGMVMEGSVQLVMGINMGPGINSGMEIETATNPVTAFDVETSIIIAIIPAPASVTATDTMAAIITVEKSLEPYYWVV